jgi:hypothetical protein
LLDIPRLASQFCALERRTGRGGRDSIDHSPGQHDDVANAVAGALLGALAAAPTLWGPEAFLRDGGPVELPARLQVVFAVLIAGRGGDAAVAYFGRNHVGGAPLLLVLDCELAPLAPALFTGTVARLRDLAEATRSSIAVLFTTQPLAEELQRLGYHAVVIDGLAAEDQGMLAVSVAVHVGAGRVKMTAAALARAEHHPLGGILDAAADGEEDPLRSAALIGIAIALDERRTLAA